MNKNIHLQTLATKNPDVIIIGGGPAACAASISCLSFGLTVTIITTIQQNYPASESVHPGVQTLLNRLGMRTPSENYSVGKYTGITGGGGFVSLDPSGKEIWEGNHIDKQIFCHYFLSLTKNKGAKIVFDKVKGFLDDSHRVSGVHCVTGAVYHAEYIIDCSGRQQLAGRLKNLKKKYYSPPLTAWSARSSAFPPGLTTSFITEIDHWNWFAPESDGSCSWTRLASKGWKDFSPPEVLNAYPLKSPPKVWNMRWRIFRPIVHPGLLLCGDAAGIIDPSASQGIITAILSGEMAAKCVADCMLRPEFKKPYLAMYDQWFLDQYENRVHKLKELYKDLMPEWYDQNWKAY